jgi:hypothetical protein
MNQPVLREGDKVRELGAYPAWLIRNDIDGTTRLVIDSGPSGMVWDVTNG